MSESNKTDHSRRVFIQAGTATAAAAAVTARLGKLRPAFAAGSDEIRVGLVGCGSRGKGACEQALRAAPGVKLVALADLFPEKIPLALTTFAKDGLQDKLDVPADRQFTGWNAYQKLLATDVNYVILATPPGFRPTHLKAAVAAGKNIFTEKPMAVDGPGIRTCLEVADEATKKGLAVGVGLQRHHQTEYLEMMKRVHGGAIGDIVSGRCYWMQKGLWMNPRKPEWSDMEWQLRNWLYFTWLSGDMINEQHIHNIDVINWGIGKPPVAAVAMGGRQVRTDPAYGHVFDHFAVDFEYPNDVHVLSMAQQIDGCVGDVSEHLVGTKGRADAGRSSPFAVKTGKKTWTPEGKFPDPYQQEHTDLIVAIRKGKPYNELKYGLESNLSAIMGRMAAYTGKRVTWEQALNSKETLAPAKLEFGKLAVAPVAMPGKTEII